MCSGLGVAFLPRLIWHRHLLVIDIYKCASEEDVWVISLGREGGTKIPSACDGESVVIWGFIHKKEERNIFRVLHIKKC